MKKPFLLLIVLNVLAGGINAQNFEKDNYLEEKIREIVNEKMKIEADPKVDFKGLPAQYKKLTIPEQDERLVAGTDTAESEVHAAINPADSNNIVLSPIKYNPYGSPPLSTPIYYSKDFGKTWKLSSFNPKPKDTRAKVVGGGDPVFVYDSTGRLYYSWINLYYTKTLADTMYWGMFWAYSDDGGETWTRPEDDVIGLSRGNYYMQKYDEVYDKQWMATDISNSPYKNTVYISYFKIQMTPKLERIVLKKKRPASNAFDTSIVEVSDDTFVNIQFTNITVDNQGHVHIIFWGSKDGSTFGVWHSVSTNGGDSFSIPNLISAAQKLTGIVGVKTSRLYPCTQLACDPVNSNLYATWTSTGTTSAGSSGSDIYFSRSTDEGASWSTAVIVNDDDKSGTYAYDQFYSSIAVNKQGTVALTWYDGRYSTSNISNNDMRYFMTKSNDGGVTFGKNFSVACVATDFRTVGNKNNYFGIGEYTQVLITNTYVIPVWADGRSNNGNLDIYAGFIRLDSAYVGMNDINVVSDKFKLQKMYPNPVSDQLNISLYLDKSSVIAISLFDIQGKKLRSYHTGKLSEGIQQQVIDTRELSPGNYVLLVESDFGYISRSFSIIRNFK
jgi:hypothetical protein